MTVHDNGNHSKCNFKFCIYRDHTYTDEELEEQWADNHKVYGSNHYGAGPTPEHCPICRKETGQGLRHG